MNQTDMLTLDLHGIPETMLWPLWNRAHEAKRQNRLLDDPMAIDLVERIDYPFEAMFGKPNVAHAIRARYGDDRIAAFLNTHPSGVVISLGEGLETQFWRINHDGVAWYTIDVPESIEVRRRLLPAHERNILIAKSALDERWLMDVPCDTPTFISAAGLLMYFEEDQVTSLLRTITRQFHEAELYFDIIPPWLSKKSMKGWKVTPQYTAPPVPFGLKLGDVSRFTEQIPGLEIISTVTYADPFPHRMRMYAALGYLSWLKNNLAPGLVHARISTDR